MPTPMHTIQHFWGHHCTGTFTQAQHHLHTTTAVGPVRTRSWNTYLAWSPLATRLLRPPPVLLPASPSPVPEAWRSTPSPHSVEVHTFRTHTDLHHPRLARPQVRACGAHHAASAPQAASSGSSATSRTTPNPPECGIAEWSSSSVGIHVVSRAQSATCTHPRILKLG